MDRSKIALISTVLNDELYQKSSKLYPQNIQKYVIDGTKGMYGIDSICYMMKKLKGKGIEWLIMADEDVFFVNSNLVFPIIEEMAQNEIMFCGVRDGGVIACRKKNPFAINTFFSILNFKELEKIWNEKEMLLHQYIVDDEFKDDLSQLKYKFEVKSLYEPYYCFYFWLRRMNKKVLFLESEMPFENDEMTNTVEDINGETLLYHTWCARYYGIIDEQTKRIDEVFGKIEIAENFYEAPIIFKDNTFAIRKWIIKLFKRLIIRVNKYK